MQNNRNRSDFADAHTDLSTDPMAPLKYLTMKNYRHVYLYILAEYADRQSSGKKLTGLVTSSDYDLLCLSHQVISLHFRAVLVTKQFYYFTVK